MSEQQRQPRPRFVIGIDPGVRTGLAAYDRQTKVITLAITSDFWGALDLITDSYAPDTAEIVIENPGLNRPTFRQHGQSGREKISQNVGSNKAEARLLIARFLQLGYPVRGIKPTSAKWDAEYVRRVTGYTRRASEHARDAIKLCYGL
jgi:hypothetical protein